jgi:hypothetical protein
VVNDGHHPDEQVEEHGQLQYAQAERDSEHSAVLFNTHVPLAEVEESRAYRRAQFGKSEWPTAL